MKTPPINHSPVIGIIGGAGPDATIDFQAELSQQMKQQGHAINDQMHFRVIVDNYTTMPDRTQALQKKGPSPLPTIQKIASNLEALGATLLAYPCNTAHAYIADIQAKVSIPVLDIISITASAVTNHPHTPQHIGILATDMTKHLQLHNIPGCTLHYPNSRNQALMMQAIFAAKAGYTKQPITDKAIQQSLQRYLDSIGIPPETLEFSYSAEEIVNQNIISLRDTGVDAVILGCTEIPLCVDARSIEAQLGMPIINPTAEMAKAAVALALSQRQPINIAEYT